LGHEHIQKAVAPGFKAHPRQPGCVVRSPCQRGSLIQRGGATRQRLSGFAERGENRATKPAWSGRVLRRAGAGLLSRLHGALPRHGDRIGHVPTGVQKRKAARDIEISAALLVPQKAD
jgi:hypothetical protein